MEGKKKKKEHKKKDETETKLKDEVMLASKESSELKTKMQEI